MSSEKKKMLNGELYVASDPVLVKEREYARKLTRLYNETLETEYDKRTSILKELFGSTGENLFVEPFFRCDYGYNIHVGENFYANFDCVILDVCEVRIGENCFMAPGVHIYTATHPLDPYERIAGTEYGKPVTMAAMSGLADGRLLLPG